MSYTKGEHTVEVIVSSTAGEGGMKPESVVVAQMWARWKGKYCKDTPMKYLPWFESVQSTR